MEISIQFFLKTSKGKKEKKDGVGMYLVFEKQLQRVRG